MRNNSSKKKKKINSSESTRKSCTPLFKIGPIVF